MELGIQEGGLGWRVNLQVFDIKKLRKLEDQEVNVRERKIPKESNVHWKSLGKLTKNLLKIQKELPRERKVR